jgi:hypothetical protein
MATKIAVASVTSNPGLHVTLSTERDRKARQGCIGEWDMLTVAGDVMTDLSGNGNNFIFINTPSVGATGVTFDGANYADMVLSAALLDSYSCLLVAKATATGGYYAFGTLNSTDNVGVSVRLLASRMDFYVGSGGNTVTGPPCTSVAWGAGLYTVERLQGRARAIRAGRLATNNALSPHTLQDTRTRWRLGAKASTSGSDHDVADNFLPAGTIVAYAMLFNRIVGYAQSMCLEEYIKAKMAARGITYL